MPDVFRWRSTARWVVIATVSGVVLAFHPRAADAFGLPKTLVLAVGTIIAAACVVLWKVESREPFPRIPGVSWLAGLVGAVAIATATSRVRIVSLVGAYTRYTGFATFLLLAVLTVVCAVAFAFDASARARVLVTIVAVACVVAVYALLQKANIDAFDFRDATGLKPDFPGSTVGNSLFAGSVCGMAFPVAVIFAWRGDARQRPIAIGAAALLIAGLWATSSRSGMLGALAGVAVVVFARPTPWRRRLLFAGATTIALVTVAGVAMVWHPGIKRPPSALGQTQVLRTESLVIRGGEWSAAARVWLSSPLVGTGPDSFADTSPAHRSHADARRFGLRVADKPHNLYLEYLSSTGVIGLAAFIAFVVAVIRAARPRLHDPEESWAVVALLSIGASYLVAAAFSFDTPATTPVAFVAAGLVFATAARPGKVGPAPMLTHSSNRVVARVDSSPWFTRVGCAVVVAGLITFAIRPMHADLEAAQALRTENRSDALSRASQHFDRAIRLDPLATTYRAEAGELAERWAALLPTERQFTPLRVAITRYQQAVDDEPGNVVFALGLARTQSEYAALSGDRADFELASQSWRKVIAHDRYDWQLHDEHAMSLNAWANATGVAAYRRDAIHELKRVLQLNPGYRAAEVNLARMQRALASP